MANDVTTKILQIQVDYGDAVAKMAQYRQQIETIKKQQTEWKKSLKEGTISQDEYAQSIEASKLQIGQYNQAISTIQKTVVNQLKQQKEQEGSLVALRAELSNLTAEYDRLSREDRESEIGTNLKNQINKVTTELKACEEGTQRFFRNVGNYKSAFADAGVGTTELTSALTKQCQTADEAAKANAILMKAVEAIDPSADGAAESIEVLNKKIEENEKVIGEHLEQSEGLVDSLSQLTGVNLNFGKSLESLSNNSAGSIMDGLNTKAKALWQTLTGLLANPYILMFLGIAGVGMAFKWWYEYNEGLVEASKRTKQFTGMSGDDMRAYRNEIQAVCDTFGADFNDVLATADALVSQYGISWNEALETVKKGFESGANANGDMLAQMQKLPAAFSSIGLSAKQMTALISQTTSGIWGADGMAAIEMSGKKIREMSSNTASALDAIGISSKKVTKDLNDGTTTTFEIMQQVAAKLKEMPESSQAVGVVLKEVFGEQGVKAGKKQIETIADINLNLDECVEATGRVGKAQEEMVQAQTELNNALSALFDSTGGSFESMTATAKLWVTQGLTAMVKGIIGVCNYLIDLYNNSIVVRAGVAGICAGFKMAWSIIKNVCGFIADEVMGLGKIIKGVLTLSWDDVSAGWDQFRKASTKAVKNIAKDYIDGVKDAVDQTLTGQLEHISEDLSSGLTGAADKSNGGGSNGNEQAIDLKDPKAAEKAKKAAAEAKKASDEAKKAKDAEIEYLRKAEDELMKITIESVEKRRTLVEQSYTRQIEDYRRKLETDKTLTETSKAAILSIIDSLEKQKQKALLEFDAEELKKTIEHNQNLIEVRLNAVREGGEEEYKLKLEQLNNKEKLDLLAAEKEITNEVEKQEMLKAIREQYAYERTVLEETHATQILDQQKLTLQNEIDNLEYAQTERQLKQAEGWQMSDEQYAAWRQRGLEEMDAHERELLLKQEEAAAAELEALIARGQLSTQTTEEYEAEIIAAKQKSAEAQKKTNDTIVKNEQAKAQAMKAITGGLTQLLDTLGESNKAFAKMSKIITLAQIAIDTGKALSAGIASASSMPFPSNIAAIATTVATVLANVATAISTVKSAKFAKGGKVKGPGTGTSDSIPAMLSNGEYVMTASATRRFEPLLEAMNKESGGTAIARTKDKIREESESVISHITHEERVRFLSVISQFYEEIKNHRKESDIKESLYSQLARQVDIFTFRNKLLTNEHFTEVVESHIERLQSVIEKANNSDEVKEILLSEIRSIKSEHHLTQKTEEAVTAKSAMAEYVTTSKNIEEHLKEFVDIVSIFKTVNAIDNSLNTRYYQAPDVSPASHSQSHSSESNGESVSPNQPKGFASGGKVYGPGTGTSDSIPVMLSNGEFVMTSAATKMFEPLLMTMNNIGKGVPMQVLNSAQNISTAEMLTDSFESAAREIKPVVSVVEITEAQDRVEMIQNLDTY